MTNEDFEVAKELRNKILMAKLDVENLEWCLSDKYDVERIIIKIDYNRELYLDKYVARPALLTILEGLKKDLKKLEKKFIEL